MIYLLGSTGKVGKSISPLLAQNLQSSFSPLIRSKSYEFLTSDDPTVLISCVYSRALFPLLITFSCLILKLLLSGRKRILIINVSSYVVMLSPITIFMKYTSLVPYFLVRSSQDLFLFLLSSFTTRITLSTLYLCRLSKDTSDYTYSSPNSLFECIISISTKFNHDNESSRYTLLYPDVIKKLDLSREDRLFSEVLKSNYSDFMAYKKVFFPLGCESHK